MIETIWFVIVALMVVAYVLLDGFDLGVGAVHTLVARNDAERRAVLQTIGPVWDGNEVWLLAAGGTLYFAFPKLYATAFSGFYLPLMIVLWLLMGRGVAIELRSHLDSELWRGAWDVVFSLSSALLVIFFGAAFGNVIRGVPIGDNGRFFLPLWTNLTISGELGIIDWFTLLAGAAALVTLVGHGATWLVMRTEGALRERALELASRTWWATAVAAVLVIVLGVMVQPQLLVSARARPWLAVFWLLVPVGLLGMRTCLSAARRAGAPSRADRNAFLASCAFIVGMLASAAFGLYPLVLPAANPALSLTVETASAAPYGLRVGLVWFVPGITLAIAYFVHTYRSFAGRVSAAAGAE